MLRSRIPQIIEELHPRTAAALQTAADLIEAKAKDRVPVNTGRLQAAIHTEFDVHGDEVQAYVIAGDREAWYGHIVEHGGAHSPAHPFLVPALEESRDQVEHDVAEVIRSIL